MGGQIFLFIVQLMQLRTQLAAKDMALKAKAGVVEADCAGPSLEHRQRAAEMAKTQGKLRETLGFAFMLFFSLLCLP